jgi:hypothetical protein
MYGWYLWDPSLIRNGTYQEIVRVSSKYNPAFRGRNRKRTVISYPNHSNLIGHSIQRCRVGGWNR